MRVSEIRAKQIRVNQGLGVFSKNTVEHKHLEEVSVRLFCGVTHTIM